jgi:hypothetical protein
MATLNFKTEDDAPPRAKFAQRKEHTLRMQAFMDEADQVVGDSERMRTAHQFKLQLDEKAKPAVRKKRATASQRRRDTPARQDHLAIHADKPTVEGPWDVVEEDNQLRSKLGERSRFGDGDGSYWDRFMTLPQPTISSYAAGSRQPRVGFKRREKGVLPFSEPVATNEEILQSLVRSKMDADVEAEMDLVEKAMASYDPGEGPSSARDFLPSLVDRKLEIPKDKDGLFYQEIKDVRSNTLKGLDPLGEKKIGSSQSAPAFNYIESCRESEITPEPLLVQKRNRRESAEQALRFEHYSLGTKQTAAVLDSLSELRHIEDLDLTNNRLGGVALSKLVAVLPQQTQLKKLSIASSKLPLSVVSAFVTSVGQLTHLICLNLSDSSLSDRHGALIFAGAKFHDALTFIDASHNTLGAQSGEAIAQLITESINMQTLKLDWNDLRGAAAKRIGESLQKNQTLTHLDVAFNAFDNLALDAMAIALRKNTTLKYLDLSSNNLSHLSAFSLTHILLHSDSIVDLRLNNNPIGRCGCEILIHTMVRMHGGDIRRISMAGCNFGSNNYIGKWGCGRNIGHDHSMCASSAENVEGGIEYNPCGVRHVQQEWGVGKPSGYGAGVCGHDWHNPCPKCYKGAEYKFQLDQVYDHCTCFHYAHCRIEN